MYSILALHEKIQNYHIGWIFIYIYIYIYKYYIETFTPGNIIIYINVHNTCIIVKFVIKQTREGLPLLTIIIIIIMQSAA